MISVELLDGLLSMALHLHMSASLLALSQLIEGLMGTRFSFALYSELVASCFGLISFQLPFVFASMSVTFLCVGSAFQLYTGLVSDLELYPSCDDTCICCVSSCFATTLVPSQGE